VRWVMRRATSARLYCAAATAAKYTFSPRLTDECGPATWHNPVLGELEAISVERKVGQCSLTPGRH
jgi:hypothetical protein